MEVDEGLRKISFSNRLASGDKILWRFWTGKGALLRELEKTVPCDPFGASCPEIRTSLRRAGRELPGRIWQYRPNVHAVPLSASDTTLSSPFAATVLQVASWARSLSFSNAKSNFLFNSLQTDLKSAGVWI
jgi:hypothetical protein